MPDGSVWAVDGHTVAHLRATYWAERDVNTTYQGEYEDTLSDDHELLDWAVGNLNWADVALTARLVSVAEVNFQEGWRCGAKKVVRPALETASASV
jgi:hypothetical protein